jgi:hypothetical protein
VYFVRGRLPRQRLKVKAKATRDTKYLLVLEKKQGTSAHELCAGLPTEFEDYMNYIRNLRDEDLPDYQHLRKIFNKLFRRQGFEYKNVFDWTIREFLRLEPDAQESLVSEVWMNGEERRLRSHEARQHVERGDDILDMHLRRINRHAYHDFHAFPHTSNS